MKKLIILGAAVMVIAAVILSCNQQSTKVAETTTEISQDSLVKRGEYLVTIMSCNDCHSPMTQNGPDPEKLLSGHPANAPIAAFDTTSAKGYALMGMTGTAMIGPWGMSFSANLTSDETGIGNWTLEQFRKAFTQGKSKGLDEGRQLLPPMPWFNFTNIKDEDLKAIFTYLKSTKPVRNVVPGPMPPNELAKYIKKS
jgi:mono/diheme cytochrome c family protein